MATPIRCKRGTRAELDAAATANGLAVAEPYYIIDEKRFAMGATTSTYIIMPNISVGTVAPISPVEGDLWVDTN